MLAIYKSNTPIELTQLQELPTMELSRRWNGTVSNHSIKVAACIDPISLHLSFEGRHTPWTHEEVALGQFREGLAERDVAELFLTQDGIQYIEFHLSPRGAWWFCDFSGVRERIHPHGLDIGAKCKVSSSSGSWRADVSFKLETLPVKLNLDSLRGNFTACIGPSPREYLSMVDLPGEKPNFHQPQKFTEITLVPYFPGAT